MLGRAVVDPSYLELNSNRTMPPASRRWTSLKARAVCGVVPNPWLGAWDLPKYHHPLALSIVHCGVRSPHFSRCNAQPIRSKSSPLFPSVLAFETGSMTKASVSPTYLRVRQLRNRGPSAIDRSAKECMDDVPLEDRCVEVPGTDGSNGPNASPSLPYELVGSTPR